ncbi:MAG: FHA domain-containing protein [Myxococcota bacterium]
MTDPGGETQISGALTMVPPVPRYEDEEAESLGEKLADLYTRRDRKLDEKVEAQIDRTRRELRRGPRLRPGEYLKDGRYRLIERMGDSAGDATWKAWDRERKCLVVVKEMVGPWVSKKMRVGSFLEAARTLQGIEHAGLGRLLEASQSRDGFVYLVTDYFEGGTLEKGWKGDAVDVLQVVVEVGNALQSAHEHELIHARVSPNNIHFGLDGGAHLVDFDLAGEHAQEERANVFVAPESVERGQRANAGSDVYGLAMCALYGLAGGKLPYTIVRNPNKFIDGLPIAETMRDVLKRAVDWDTDTRYASMSAFVEAILADGTVLESLAERAFERQRYVIASEHYTRLWSLRPNDSVQIKRILGTIYLRMEAWEEAFECLSTALEESAEPDTLFPLLREFAAGTDGWRRVADVLWNQARERTSVLRASMRAELARITEEQLSDPTGAAEIWSMVVVDHRLPRRGEEALRALARLAESRGDWAAMVDHSQQLLPYIPEEERPQVQYAIGRAFVKHLGDEDAGLHWIDKAEAAGIKPLDLTSELQDLRARRGQWRRVIALMRLEADHEKKVHNASRILLRAATIARAVHLDPEAEAIYENMLERAPQHYPALRELARMRHRAGQDDRAAEAYQQLTSIYEGKSEEPEASERAADHTAYAELLLDQARYDDAIAQLEAALALQPDNCEALKLAGPLYLDMGKLEEGSAQLERLYALFKAVRTHGERLEAAIQRADAAWFRGRLAVAMRWYNTVLDTVPEHAEAWWGLAKVALAARGGHPGADRAPWLANTPDRFTPQEALARLFMGMFSGEALSDWLSRHPLGNGVADAGATSGRLACAAVDLLTRYGCVDADLFSRLSAAYPRWERRIRAVETLWLSGDPEFRFARSYRWARTALDHDFLPTTHRIVLPLGDPIRGRLITGSAGAGTAEFGTDEHWASLIGTPSPAEVEPEAPEGPRQFEGVAERPSVEFLLGDAIEFEMPSFAWEARIGSAPDCDWVVPGLSPSHASISRRGSAVYIEAVGEAELAVEGDQVPGWRLMGGETVQLGSNLWDIRVVVPDPSLEPPVEASAPHALAADFADELSDYPDSADPTWEGVDPEASSGPSRAAAVLGPVPDEPEAAAADAHDDAPDGDDDGEALPTDFADDVTGATEEGDARVLDALVSEADAADEAEDDPELEDEPEVHSWAGPEDSEAEEPEVDEAPPADSAHGEDDDDPVSSDGPVYFDASLIEERVRGADDEPDATPAAASYPLSEEDEVPTTATTRDAMFAQLVVEEPLDDEPEEDGELEDDDGAADVVYGDSLYEPVVEARGASDGEPRGSTDPVKSWGAEDDADDFASSQGDRDYDYDDYDDQAATQIRHNPLAGSTFMDLDMPGSDEDSLGPAGDAPTPQWVVTGDADDDANEVDATKVQIPVLQSERGDSPGASEPVRFPPIGSSDLDLYEKRDLQPVEMTGEEPLDAVTAVSRSTAVLEIMSGPARGTQVAVRGVVALGRDEACEVYLPADPMLAPLHCRFVQTDDSFLVMDNGTERGTVVNGTRVSEAILSGGETIMVGSTVLRFQVQHV